MLANSQQQNRDIFIYRDVSLPASHISIYVFLHRYRFVASRSVCCVCVFLSFNTKMNRNKATSRFYGCLSWEIVLSSLSKLCFGLFLGVGAPNIKFTHGYFQIAVLLNFHILIKYTCQITAYFVHLKNYLYRVNNPFLRLWLELAAHLSTWKFCWRN